MIYLVALGSYWNEYCKNKKTEKEYKIKMFLVYKEWILAILITLNHTLLLVFISDLK